MVLCGSLSWVMRWLPYVVISLCTNNSSWLSDRRTYTLSKIHAFMRTYTFLALPSPAAAVFRGAGVYCLQSCLPVRPSVCSHISTFEHEFLRHVYRLPAGFDIRRYFASVDWRRWIWKKNCMSDNIRRKIILKIKIAKIAQKLPQFEILKNLS